MSAETYPQGITPHKAQTRSWISIVGVAALIGYIAFLLFFRLDQYPRAHFDEGAFMKVAKKFALHGVYADFSNEGDRYTGAIVSTGPTLMLPIALAYKVFGPSWLLGRVVAVIYAALMLVGLYAAGTRLLDKRLALTSVILMAIHPRVEFRSLGRTALGELPGLFFMFVGLWLWLAPGKSKLPRLIGAGVLFGLACITKNQLALFILPGLLISFLLELIWYRRRGWLHFVIPGIVAGLMYFSWTYYIFFLHGAHVRDVAQDMASVRELSANSFFVFDPTIVNNNLDILIGGDFFFVPAVLFGVLLSLRKTDEGQSWSIITLFTLGAATIYIFSNVWDLYSAPARVLGFLLTARMLYSLTDGFRFNWQEIRAALRTQELSRDLVIRVLVVGLLLTMFARPFYMHIRTVLTEGNKDTSRVIAYIEAQIPQNSLIATWESELGVETEHTYHFLIRSPLMSKLAKKLGPLMESQRSLRDYMEAEYIIVGYLAKREKLYIPENLAGYELIQRFGDYEIYRWRGQIF